MITGVSPFPGGPASDRSQEAGLAAGFRLGLLEPTLGFEPRTCCLRNSCSTAELCRRRSRIADAQGHQLFALMRTRLTSCSKPWHNARTADDYLTNLRLVPGDKNARSIAATSLEGQPPDERAAGFESGAKPKSRSEEILRWRLTTSADSCRRASEHLFCSAWALWARPLADQPTGSAALLALRLIDPRRADRDLDAQGRLGVEGDLSAERRLLEQVEHPAVIEALLAEYLHAQGR